MSDRASEGGKTVFSIGHSNHTLEAFLHLLTTQHIDALADVRSHPYSKYASQFDRQPLKVALTAAGIRYLFLGEELGGQPSGAEFYDADGHVLYARVAESPAFLHGIARLEQGAQRHRVAILCGEENPAGCHRRLLVGRMLAARGITVDHIRGDGRVQTEEELVLEETGGQGDLFADQEGTATWRRSSQSVLPGKPRPSSSGR